MSYFGFDGDTEGFEKILTRIAENHGGARHDHKSVRTYARCLLQILPEISIDSSIRSEVKILLAALSAAGLPHYDRAFLATAILTLLEESVRAKAYSPLVGDDVDF